MRKTPLVSLAEEIGRHCAEMEARHRRELTEMRAQLARLEADVAALKVAPLGEVEAMLQRFEARLIEAIERPLRQARTTAPPPSRH